MLSTGHRVAIGRHQDEAGESLKRPVQLADLNRSRLSRLPILTDDCDPKIRSALRIRALRLSCLTRHYADLWYGACIADLPTATNASS